MLDSIRTQSVLALRFAIASSFEGNRDSCRADDVSSVSIEAFHHNRSPSQGPL